MLKTFLSRSYCYRFTTAWKENFGLAATAKGLSYTGLGSDYEPRGYEHELWRWGIYCWETKETRRAIACSHRCIHKCMLLSRAILHCILSRSITFAYLLSDYCFLAATFPTPQDSRTNWTPRDCTTPLPCSPVVLLARYYPN